MRMFLRNRLVSDVYKHTDVLEPKLAQKKALGDDRCYRVYLVF